ncbi:hypothetical protein BED65_15515 [Listeria monocytogenes]|nr:hypothetical protein [Listeria monocytogenes]
MQVTAGQLEVHVITADTEAIYKQGEFKTEAHFLQDIHAKTSDGPPVTSNFEMIIIMNVPGDCQVESHSSNADNISETVLVTIYIFSKQQDKELSTFIMSMKLEPLKWNQQ